MMKKRSSSVVILSCLLLTLFTAQAAQAATTLKVQMIGYFDAIQYLQNVIIPAFEAKYDVKVEFERTTWGNRQEKLIVGTAAGAPPDVYMNGAENIVDLVNAGLVEPLDRYIAKWPDIKDFAPATLQNSAFNGHQYGVPLYTDTRAFFYRTDFFEEVGLNPNDPPSNWEELLQAAKRLTKTDGGSKVIRQGYDLARWTGNTSGHQDLVPYIWQNGGEFINQKTFEATFNQPKAVEAMQFMVNLQDAVRMSGYTVDPGQGQGSAIVRGTAAINLNTGAVVSETYKIDPDVAEYIRAIVPPPGQVNRVSVTFSNWLAIHPDSKNKDLAWEFIKTMCEAKTLAEWDSLLGSISPRKSTVSMFTRKQPIIKYLYDTLDYVRPYPVFPSIGGALSSFQEQYKLIMNGKIGVKAGLDEAARLWNLAIKGGN